MRGTLVHEAEDLAQGKLLVEEELSASFAVGLALHVLLSGAVLVVLAAWVRCSR